MAATLKIPTAFTAVDKFSRVIRTMGKSVTKFSKKTGAAIQRFDQKITKSFRKLGRLARQGLGIGLGFALLGSINIIKNYEQSVADLAAVMNTTTVNQNLLSADAKRLGAITAKSATEVTGLQQAFARLGFETPQIINMTEATISGSIAMNAELADTAELVGAMVKTFDSFSSIDAPDILDKLTLATQKSALNFEKLQTALPIVSGAANAAGIPFETMVALLGKLSDAGIDASMSSTALRNIFIESAAQGLNFSQILDKIEKNQSKLTAANDEFGKRAAVPAAILSGKLQEVEALTGKLTTGFKGTSAAAADTRLDTFAGSLTLLSSAYEGLLLNTNDSTGALGIFKNIIQFVTRNIETIAGVLGVLASSFILLKAVVIGSKIAMVAYNIVLGLTAVFQGGLTKAIASNTIALGAYKAVVIAISAVTKIWSVIQLAFNIIMAANPVVIIILAIIAAVAAIILVVRNWGAITKWFGNLWKKFTGFIGGAWKRVVKFFKEFDFKAFFKNIGMSILRFLLLPMKGLLLLLSKIPGKIGRIASAGLEKIGKITGDVKVTDETGGRPKVVAPGVQSAKTTKESIQQNNISLEIKDKGNNVGDIRSDGDTDIPINISRTQAAF